MQTKHDELRVPALAIIPVKRRLARFADRGRFALGGGPVVVVVVTVSVLLLLLDLCVLTEPMNLDVLVFAVNGSRFLGNLLGAGDRFPEASELFLQFLKLDVVLLVTLFKTGEHLRGLGVPRPRRLRLECFVVIHLQAESVERGAQSTERGAWSSDRELGMSGRVTRQVTVGSSTETVGRWHRVGHRVSHGVSHVLMLGVRLFLEAFSRNSLVQLGKISLPGESNQNQAQVETEHFRSVRKPKPNAKMTNQNPPRCSKPMSKSQ